MFEHQEQTASGPLAFSPSVRSAWIAFRLRYTPVIFQTPWKIRIFPQHSSAATHDIGHICISMYFRNQPARLHRISVTIRTMVLGMVPSRHWFYGTRPKRKNPIRLHYEFFGNFRTTHKKEVYQKKLSALRADVFLKITL